MGDALGRLQDLLRQLFQFESKELDFGIYRIMNHKRGAIEDFIRNGLPRIVDAALSSGAAARQSARAEEFRQKAEQVRETFGDSAIDSGGELKEGLREFPLGGQYLQARSRAGGAVDLEDLKAEIFNHVHTFFSRYYDDGDFLSKQRYSRRQKYAVPYNGEEVYLHWANADQYYVKTGEHFADYRYRSGGVTVHFELTAADTEQNNVKGERRYFVPRAKDAAYDEETNVLTVPFEYRPLTAKEQAGYGGRNGQGRISEKALEELPARFQKHPDALAALVSERRKNAKGEPVSLLEHHLGRYTRRNTSDFFVHKDLKGFLEGELDFYLKNEVLDVDDLDAWGSERSESWFEVMRAVKRVGRGVIAFLAQIEDFQKMLFEKKKLVISTGYCVTLDRVPEELYAEIAANEAQREEWKNLFAIDEIEENITQPGYSEPLTEDFLKANPFLVLDTKYFDEDFKDRLLASIEDLDGQTDGLLIESENFQALNLLQERYREQVKCIYIDPPYNTGSDGFLYKDTYQHSSWLSMVEDRLRASRVLLGKGGVAYSSVDDNELLNLCKLFDACFGAPNHLGSITWRNVRDNNPTRIAVEHEYVTCFAKDIRSTASVWKSPFSTSKELLLDFYDGLVKQGLSKETIQGEYRQFIRDNASIVGELERYKFVDDEGPYTGSESVHNPHPNGYDYEILHPETGKPMRKPANGYRFPEETMQREYIDKGRLLYGPDENRIVKIKLYLRDYLDTLRSVLELDGRLGAYRLNALFGRGKKTFDNPKPVELLERLVSLGERIEREVKPLSRA